MTERGDLFNQREVAAILGIPWDELPKHTAYFINATRWQSTGGRWYTGYTGKDIVLMFLGLWLQEFGLAARNARGIIRVVEEWWEWYWDESWGAEEDGEEQCILISKLLPGGTITSHTTTLSGLTAHLSGSLAEQPILVLNLEAFISRSWQRVWDYEL